MKSFENDAHGGSTKDAFCPRLAGLGRRDLMKGGVGIAVTQMLGAGVKAAGATRKIALEEHFTTPALAKKYVARPTRSDTLFADIERRLADFDQLRVETMDKAGIDLAVLSVTTPGVQAEADPKTDGTLTIYWRAKCRSGRSDMQGSPIFPCRMRPPPPRNFSVL
jgi:hypothetical protein